MCVLLQYKISKKKKKPDKLQAFFLKKINANNPYETWIL